MVLLISRVDLLAERRITDSFVSTYMIRRSTVSVLRCTTFLGPLIVGFVPVYSGPPYWANLVEVQTGCAMCISPFRI